MYGITMLQPRDSALGMYEYQQCLVAAWERSGRLVTKDVRIPRIVRAVLAKVLVGVHCTSRKDRILIAASWKIDVSAFPWSMFREIVPVMWDVWPGTFDALVRFVKQHKVRTLFCTSSQQVQKLNDMGIGVKAIWLPEAIDVSKYPTGPQLSQRQVDVLEFGRRMKLVHDALLNYEFNRKIVHDFPADRLVAVDNDEFKARLRNAKIVICYPKSDTNPESAGGIETLTLRYWECMCSGALVVGRAPRELIEVCGYNPVIELKDNYACKIENILERGLENGRLNWDPYLGRRECHCYFRNEEFGTGTGFYDNTGTNVGFDNMNMFFDWTYLKNKTRIAHFGKIKMVDGVVQYPSLDSNHVCRIVKMKH